jgi:hypothetical protein
MKKTNLTETEKANLEARYNELEKEYTEIVDKLDCLPIGRTNWVAIAQQKLESRKQIIYFEQMDILEILNPPTEESLGCWCRMAGRKFRDEHPVGYRYNETRDGMEIWRLL